MTGQSRAGGAVSSAAFIMLHTAKCRNYAPFTSQCYLELSETLLRLTGVLFRLTKVVFRLTGVLFRLTKVVFRLTGELFRLTKVVFRLTGVLFRLTKVVFRLTGVLFRLTKVVFRLTGLHFSAEQFLYLADTIVPSALKSHITQSNHIFKSHLHGSRSILLFSGIWYLSKWPLTHDAFPLQPFPVKVSGTTFCCPNQVSRVKSQSSAS